MLWKYSLVACVSVFVNALFPVDLNAQSLEIKMPIAASLANTSREAFARKPSLLIEPRPRLGTVLICGGGALPRRIRENFHEIGQGIHGSLVLIPTASPRSDTEDYSGWLDYWASFTWKNVYVLHCKSREEAFQPQWAEVLRGATAVWVSGGDQRRLSDRYVGTPIAAELHALLQRGGIIGGTSAGAAIASNNMISGGLVEPQFSEGLGLVPGAIVDQHFSMRNRYERLSRAVKSHPDCIGIGIDESTGVFIDSNQSRVVGDGSVYLLQPNSSGSYSEKESDAEMDDVRLQEGDCIPTRDLLMTR